MCKWCSKRRHSDRYYSLSNNNKGQKKYMSNIEVKSTSEEEGMGIGDEQSHNKTMLIIPKYNPFNIRSTGNRLAEAACNAANNSDIENNKNDKPNASPK